MRNKKYFYLSLTTILSVFLITLGWVYFVYGTTIGTNISTGNMTIAGSASTTGTLDTVGNFRVNTDKLTVIAATGNTTIAGTLTVATTTIGTTFYIDVNGNASTTGGFIVGGTVSLASTTINNTLAVTGTSTLASTTINNTLAVTGTSTFGGGTAITKIYSELSASINLASAASNTCVTATDAVAGAALGNTVIVTPSLDDAAWDIGNLTGFVESAGTVKIVYCNNSVDASNPADMTYRITLIQF